MSISSHFVKESPQIKCEFFSVCFHLQYKGFAESVVAAALSRVGLKVLHLDRSVKGNINSLSHFTQEANLLG